MKDKLVMRMSVTLENAVVSLSELAMLCLMWGGLFITEVSVLLLRDGPNIILLDDVSDQLFL
jgi:hypothetical protein